MEPDATDACRYARYDPRAEPDPAWADACAPRYQRFRELAGP